MPQLSTLTYSRTTTVTATTTFLFRLTRMYLPPSCILSPPATGWPHITPATFFPVRKTDEVIRLLAQLSYVLEPSLQALPGGQWADWTWPRQGWGLRKERKVIEGEGVRIRVLFERTEHRKMPAHVVKMGNVGSEGLVVLLDTRRGVVWWVEGCPGKVLETADVVDDNEAVAVEEEWRGGAPGWTVEKFFEMVEREFCALRLVPGPGRREFFDAAFT